MLCAQPKVLPSQYHMHATETCWADQQSEESLTWLPVRRSACSSCPSLKPSHHTMRGPCVQD